MKHTNAVKYMERRTIRTSTKPHVCYYSVLARVKGNNVRLSCPECPSMTEWISSKLLFADEYRRFKEFKEQNKRSGGAPVYGYSTRKAELAAREANKQRRASKSWESSMGMMKANWAHNVSEKETVPSAWTTNDEGLTPDEKSDWVFKTDEVVVAEFELPKEGELTDENRKKLAHHTQDEFPRESMASQLKKYTKDDLIERYPTYIKKSWTKDKMIESIVKGVEADVKGALG